MNGWDVLKYALEAYWGFMMAHPFFGTLLTAMVLYKLPRLYFNRGPFRRPTPDTNPLPLPEPSQTPAAPGVEVVLDEPLKVPSRFDQLKDGDDL